MKVFVSHSSKDAELAKALSFFLKNLNMDIDVFCTSILGVINQGEDFVQCIENGLQNSDVFIPLISKNYIESKYCLIELGYAYSKSISHKKNYYILPFCVPPITRSEALLGTPMAHLQTSALNDKDDMENFLRILIKSSLIPELAIMNGDVFAFVNKVNNIVMKSENILDNAIILPICSDYNNPNAIQHIQEDNKHIVNFNLFANGTRKRPEFISLVFKFPGTFNFYNFLQSNVEIKFLCEIYSYTDSLTDIDVEFKYHEPSQMLKSYKFKIKEGINNVEIAIKDMNIEGLKHISEICFVCRDEYIIEEEGMFSIKNIQVKAVQYYQVGGAAKKVGKRIKELERLYGIKQGGSGFYGNQYTETLESSNNFKTPKTQEQLAKDMGMTVDTLQNYKMLADMIPEIDDMKVLFIIIAF